MYSRVFTAAVAIMQAGIMWTWTKCYCYCNYDL